MMHQIMPIGCNKRATSSEKRRRRATSKIDIDSTLLIYCMVCALSIVAVSCFDFSSHPNPSLPISPGRSQQSFHSRIDLSHKRHRSSNSNSFPTTRPIHASDGSITQQRATNRQFTTLSGSLIAPDDSWGNLATLAAVGVSAQRLGNSTAVGRLLGAPVTAMAITFGLASVGVLAPGGTSTSRNLQGLAIKFATPWILLGADFGGNRKSEDQSTLVASSSSSSSSSSTMPLVFGFLLASLATLAGGCIGWKVTGRALIGSALGAHDGLAIAAALLAKNIGGGINYVAVCAALQASPSAIATGLCIDNIGALVYFPISNLLASRYPDPAPKSDEANNDTLTKQPDDAPKMTVESISVAFFAATALLWLGEFLATRALKSPSAQIPVVTLLAVILAGIVAPRVPSHSNYFAWRKPREDLKRTCDVLGTVCLYLFFTTAGAPGIRVAKSMVSALWPLSVFSVLLYAIHGGILASLYQLLDRTSRFQKLWRQQENPTKGSGQTTTEDTLSAESNPSWSWRDVFSPQRLLVASSSAIGGPPTSVALARTVGWDSLVVPALLVGNIGYAVSTFVGIAFYYCFK